MDLKGKKAFCFIALKHHGRFLFPITRALEKRGMKVLYPTAPAEDPFEITLLEQGLPYHHTFSYLNAEVAKRTEAAYREVRAIWRDRILESPILHHFTLCLQDKALRMHVENFYLFRRMFEVEKPDVVLALHEMNSWGKMLGYLCHEFGIPYITFQEGLYWGPTRLYHFHTEYSTACLVWGEATREILINSAGCGDKIFIVGNTNLEAVIPKVTDPAALKRAREELDIPGHHRVVTVLMGGLGYSEKFEFPKELLNWAKKTPKLTLFFKWHPFSNKGMIDKITQGLKGVPNIRSVQSYDTYRLLAVSDACILFGNSTTGLEALALGKPLLEVELPGQAYSFSTLGVAEPVPSLAAIPAAVKRLWKEGVPPERKKTVAAYLQRNLSSLDGKSVERTLDIITKSLSVRESQKERATFTLRPEPAQRNGTRDFLCSIVIPFSSAAQVTETLTAIAHHTPPELRYECILVSGPNAHETELLSEFFQGDIRLLSSSSSELSGLCNLGAKEARGRYLCFLPAGLVPQEGWLEALLKELETGTETQNQVGVVGGKIVYPNGLIAHAGVVFDANFSPSLLYHLLPAAFPSANRVRRMRAVAGPLLVLRELFFSLGSFDGEFKAALHDVDLCLQAGLAGRRVVYTPDSLFFTFSQEEKREEPDRLHFYGKWMGHLWPDEEERWLEDGLRYEKLAEFYENVLTETKVSSAPAD